MVNLPFTDKKKYGYKKGFVGDMFVAILIFGWLATLFLVFMTYVSQQVTIATANVLTSNTAQTWMTQSARLLNLFDYIIPFLTLGACIAALVYAAFLKTSPILFGAGFIFLCVLTYTSFYLSNIFYQIVVTANLQAQASLYPHALYMPLYMPVIEFVMTILYLVVGITKWRTGGFAPAAASPVW